ncbi:Sensor histidine kinase RcsC [Methylobacterium gregans]|uniref:histidine kinase n=1 Tax=Methylobacterium gregans TaxID=374424 RepID=A0AA37HPL6_9HYPH|nr:PAS domain-containing protein [Methylobacterium gregans]MDQ0523257.1 PAS domain S-box-containing protein [Methylobacterium gregans]GJD78823.1 Sensor histidine kinase RcsC [Methylobacterium gregans]
MSTSPIGPAEPGGDPAGLPPALRFLAEGSLTGREILARDWSGTALGPPAAWPVSLRTTLATMLACPSAMFLAWGPDLLSFYNDAYRPILGDRLGRALGARFPDLWADVWADVGPLCAGALAGRPIAVTDLPLTMHRHGAPEETWWSFTYSPVRDDAGAIAGMICTTAETTAHVLAERRRRASDQRLELALSAGNGIGTWDWDIPNDRVTADARFARLYGVDPEKAARGAPIAEFFAGIHPEDTPRLQAAIAAVMRTGGDFAAEYRLLRADAPPGEAVRWVMAQGHCILDPDGRPARFPGATFDITERRLAAEALAASEARLRNAAAELRVVADILPILVAVVGPDYRYGFANAAYRTWHGVDPAWMIGRTVEEVIGPQAFAATRARIDRALAGTEVEFETTLPHVDGRERIGAVRFRPRRAPDGMVEGIHVFVQDVTERRSVEAALTREVEARTRERDRLWETTSDLMGTLGGDGYLKSVNPAWTRMLGWSAEALLASPLLDRVDPADHAAVSGLMERLAAGETVTAFIDRVICADGERRTVMWTAVPEGNLSYVVGRDITEQRQAEAALRQAQKMEAVGQLTGGIAHDFNNLLTGIVGSLDLMQTRIRQGRGDQIEKYIAAALACGQRAAALTHRLLAFARRQPLEPRPVAADALIAGMEELLRRTLSERIALEITAADDLWPTLCDPHQLENAILNLAINARDAMPEGGRLTIAARNAALARTDARRPPSLAAGDYVQIRVTDTGTGMAPEVIAKAFDPFFTTKPIGQGTGLGLSMIYGFAQQSEGHVAIASEPGRGTTISLYLPRYRGTASPVRPPEPEAAVPVGRGETVLVVEDEAVVRDLIVEVLHDLGYRALEAADGLAGLALVEGSGRIDLLVTDVGLPGLDGRRLAERARALRPGLKVLFITGYAENATFGDAAEAGAQMITKPFAVEALAARIRTIIEG